MSLRRVGVPREYQLAIDEARGRTIQEEFLDEGRDGPQAGSKDLDSAAVLLIGDLLQTPLQYELVVGFTRLANLLGSLDR